LRDLIEKYRRVGAKLVVLFGSRARGDYTNISDYDVLVVADNLPRDPSESYSILYDEKFPSVNPIGINTVSFLKKLREENTFILEVLEDGKVLYADEKFLEEVKGIYKAIRATYIRRGKTWIKLKVE